MTRSASAISTSTACRRRSTTTPRKPEARSSSCRWRRRSARSSASWVGNSGTSRSTRRATGSLLGQARTNRAAGYFLNQLWFTDTLRLVSAGRVEPVRLDGTSGIFPASLMPPPDNPTLVQQSLDYVPKSISFKVLKDLPSWMVGSATVQRIERAPTALELFAHGAHDAPGTFDIGDPHLKI